MDPTLESDGVVRNPEITLTAKVVDRTLNERRFFGKDVSHVNRSITLHQKGGSSVIELKGLSEAEYEILQLSTVVSVTIERTSPSGG